VLTGKKTWQMVTTDINGFNDSVCLTWLAQVCKLNLGESPFWGDWGIPAHESVVTQVAPDYYMNRIQQQFAPRFASVLLMRLPDAIDDSGNPSPNYQISVLTNYGARIGFQLKPDYPPEQPT
jgi:hypothetical protein